MKKPTLLLLSAVVLASACLPSRGAEPTSLEETLQKEASGFQVDRRKLASSRAEDKVSLWHAGMVKVPEGDWKAIETLASNPQSDQYEKKRAEFEGKPSKHLSLARWCARNDMPQRARAHYFGVLMGAPNHAEARDFLGHSNIGGQWIADDVLESARTKLHNSLDSLDHWTPILKTIVAGLHSGKAKQMQQSLANLANVDAADALPAMEFFATHIDDDLARPLVRKISELRSADACLALVRIALRHPSHEIRQQTSETIRTYPQHYFVPQLLGMLSTELQVANNLVMYPNGTIGLDTVIGQELPDRKRMNRAQKAVAVVAAYSSDRRLSLVSKTKGEFSYWSNFWAVPKSKPIEVGKLSRTATRVAKSNRESDVYVPRDVALTAAQNLFEEGKQRERATAQQNRQLNRYLNSICGLLRATTGEEFGDDAKLWWTWWNDHNERYQSEKPTQYSYQQERERIAISSESYTNESKVSSEYDFGKMMIQYSCLVPGTLVQTSTGLVPIEKIKIGDMVLSQDVETAELALKPVLLTTIRPPKTTIKIKTGSDTIEATGGHLWWVSGKGWVKTRDLKPSMTLHTATGTVEIESLAFNPSAQRTYNLVVDGMHTYFVGPHRVLSYDNTILRPTLRQLPGYGLVADATK
ncbi:MAG: hypothetical protein Aurels2KO_06450 [Aureliella sp.]